MENIFIMILFFVILGVYAPFIYKMRIKDNVIKEDITYDVYWANGLWLFLIVNIIYNSNIDTTRVFIIFFIAWGIYKILLRTDRAKKLEKSPNFYKILAVLGPFIGIILELFIFLNKGFGPVMFAPNKLQFKIFAIISILLLIWLLYFNVRPILNFILKKRDGFRKVFIVGEVIVVLIYSAFTIFYIFNTNLLTFY